MELKENVVYTLPDGRELIARLGSTGFLLHDPTKGVGQHLFLSLTDWADSCLGVASRVGRSRT